MNSTTRRLLGAGLLIPFWLSVGVWLTAKAFPGYSHSDQAMSQLGALGAPTHVFSAWVNNFPLALLFGLFALGIWRCWRGSMLARLSALLILLHGLGSLGTGFFPCDQGCAPADPSTAQRLHNLSGLVMFVSLTLASALWVWLGVRVARSRGFSWFSLACTGFAVLTAGFMASAVESGHLFGFYQRLNYGVSVAWTAGLALISLRRVDDGTPGSGA
ncbi:DUF998 domain-containing protein [Pseudomonas sp. Marseille-QA0332]